jgi:hypothetical protein
LREAVEIESERLSAYVLSIYLEYLSQEERFQEALEVLGFLEKKMNQASEPSPGSSAPGLLEELTARLSPAEIQAGLGRGAELDIETLIARLENE